MNDKQFFFVYLMVKFKKKKYASFYRKKNKHLIKLFGNIAISWNIVQVT